MAAPSAFLRRLASFLQAAPPSGWRQVRWAVVWLIGLTSLLAPPGLAQEVILDEPAGEPDYWEASDGEATGGDALTLAGPSADNLPLTRESAFSGAVSGQLRYRHTEGGTWTLRLGADGWRALDLTASDSLVVYLNAPGAIPAPDLPRVGLEDEDGVPTALLPLAPGGALGYNAARSGFQTGGTTDARLAVSYVDVLPTERARPGYPEDLLITFADGPVDTSVAAIGAPAVPARFTIETQTGLRLAFRFRDTDGDATLSAADEYIEVLTPEDESSERLRPTWRVELAGTLPQQPPTAGDVFLLAVDNAGIDGDPATWQRLAVALSGFGPLGRFDRSRVRSVRFENGAVPTAERTLWFDVLQTVNDDPSGTRPEPPGDITAEPGDASVVLRWARAPGAIAYHVYRRPAVDTGEPFERLTTAATVLRHFADLSADNGVDYTYVIRSVAFGGRVADGEPVPARPEAGLPDAYLELVARTAFDYFWQEANPVNGLVKDRSTETSPASIAAVGFGLSAITVGIDRGWISREAGAERVASTLEFFWNSPQSATDPTATGYRGFYYHFLDMQTGRRAWSSELSTIDTALLLGGVLHAKTYFDAEDDREVRIRALADSLYERVEWDWAAPRPPLVALGWRPESGFLPFDWRGYNEAMILYILALGSPTHPLPPEAWTAWTETYRWATHYGHSFVVFPPLFGHQYSHVWIDFRGIQDAYMREKGIDYFENSRRATLANRAYAIDNPRGYPNYGPDEWGLTASDIPGGYRARGAPPAQNDDGTIAPTAAGGSLAFTPEASRAALRRFYAAYRSELWGPYGLRDAYNIRESWFASDYIGIDQGPILLMYENLRTEAIWTRFMQHEAIRRGLERAGFEPVGTAVEEADTPGRASVTVYPNPVRDAAILHYVLPYAGQVRLELYDVLGRRVRTLVDTVLPAQEHVVAVDAAGLAAGVYLYVLHADGQRVAGRFIVRH